MPEPPHPELDKQAWARQERPGEFVRFYIWFTTERGYRWCTATERDELEPFPRRFVFTLWSDNLYAPAGSQELGAFLEECEEAGLVRARWLPSNLAEVKQLLDEEGASWLDQRWPTSDPRYHPAGWYVLGGSIEDLLAAYYGIDRDKIEDERRAILAQIRGMSDAEEAHG